MDHPAYFQVMFQPDLLRPDDPDLLAAKARAAAELRTGVEKKAAPAEDADLMGIAAWSIAHGFATLLLSQNLDRQLEGRSAEDVFRALTRLTFRAH